MHIIIVIHHRCEHDDHHWHYDDHADDRVVITLDSHAQ